MEQQPDLPDFGDDLDPAYTDQHHEHHLKPPAPKKKLRGVCGFFLSDCAGDLIKY